MVVSIPVLFFFLLCSPAYAEGPESGPATLIEVRASALPGLSSLEDAPAWVIPAEELARHREAPLPELLRRQPGVQLVQSGAGGVAGLLLRGAGPSQTLVVVDGVKMNDPLNPDQSFDFSSLRTEEIEKIEILRGAQSLAYGSGASGGVVRITTRALRPVAEGRATAVRIGLGAGSHRSGTAHVAVAARDPENSGRQVMFAFDGETSAGISMASEASGNTEPDGRRVGSLKGFARTPVGAGVELETQLRFARRWLDTDYSGGPGGDDSGGRAFSRADSLRLAARKADLERVQAQVHLAALWADRDDDREASLAHPLPLHARFEARRFEAGGGAEWELSPYWSLSAGLEQQVELGRAGDLGSAAELGWQSVAPTWRSALSGGFARLAWHDADRRRWSVEAGARLDRHDRFGKQGTYRLAAAWSTGEWLLRTGIGTAFKAPTLYQLYSTYGSPSLAPERSWSVELGLEGRSEALRSSWGATAYLSRFSEQIGFDNALFRYQNLGKARSRGLELDWRWLPVDDWAFRFGGAALEAKDEATGLALLRRARFTGTAQAVWTATSSWELGLGGRAVSAREDIDMLGGRLTLAGYALWDVWAAGRLAESLRITLRLSNLADRAYEDVAGYGSLGRTVFVGVERTL